jgi:hypothetical protein
VRSTADGGGLVELSDERVLQEVGIYRYHHPLENAVAYRERLAELDEQIKALVVRGDAIEASEMFTFNNSLAKGRKMVADLSKLMLRAYNAEADNCVRSLRAGNVVTAKKRLDAAVQSIARLGSMMETRVNPRYHTLRVEEIELTADYLMKVQEERELAREERERLREERRVAQELAAERERLDRVRELGDASVPFPFAVHALFFSDDAVTLETELHHAFADRKVNWVNERREFFFASPSQVRDTLESKVGALLEFTDEPEATQYLQSRGYWPTPLVDEGEERA